MFVCKYDSTLLFLIEGLSKHLPLHRPEVKLNQFLDFFLLVFEKCDLRAISHLVVDILPQLTVLIL